MKKLEARDIAKHRIKLVGLCQVCNKKKATERHHPDYYKPKEVILVCNGCHRKIHTKKKGCGRPLGNSFVVSLNCGEDGELCDKCKVLALPAPEKEQSAPSGKPRRDKESQ